MNRLIYDQCSYSKELKQSTSPFEYVIDPIKFENHNKCRMELGIVGGTAVSHIKGNLVDLENDLRNQNRPNTRCPAYKWIPGEKVQGNEYIKPVQHPHVDTTMQHLPSCQMHEYPSVPLPPTMNMFKCSR